MEDELDDFSGVPRSVQIARLLEAEIRSGVWMPKHPVPSRNQLADRYGVARETAAKAHAILADRGYIVALPGLGMVVRPRVVWEDAEPI